MKTVTSLITILFFFTLIVNQAVAQGYLMLAGGAGESAGGWSDEPYAWVVGHASNKRMAIISYNCDETDWIPNYFKSFGAVAAKNFCIPNKSTANQQWLYDSLITYNGIFIKGGDQWNYYNYYKGTKTQEALQFIFDNGGVLSGTSAGTMILSPIIFTAQVASVDPAVAIANAYSSQITLANDFLKTIPGNYIFDTHFIERGRFGRLPAFMASWYKKQGENTIGIGIDDHTALCIEPNGSAVVYGTGSVGFYTLLDTIEPFDVRVKMLESKKMNFSQAIHGCTLDMKTIAIEGLAKFIQPPIAEENESLRIFISGTDYPSDDAFNFLVNQVGQPTDAILIVTGTNLTLANNAKTKLESNGATSVEVIQGIASNSGSSDVYSSINKAKKLVIIGNDYSGFMTFINAPGNGPVLNESLHKGDVVSFFVGDNARFTGKTVIEKYMGAGYTSYHGELEFLPGLALLKTTAIMANTYINVDYYENTVSGLPFAMMRDSLEYGLYITGTTFAEYHYNNNHSYFKNISGTSPLIFLQNSGTLAGFAAHGPYSQSRNIVGFDSMHLQFLGEADTVTVGHRVPVYINSILSNPEINIFPNPASEQLVVQGVETTYSLQCFDITGQMAISKDFENETNLSLAGLPNGFYFIKVINMKTGTIYTSKIFINHEL